jgi:hypothetical protein
MKRFLWLGWVAFLSLLCAGCGDTFRPIIIPNAPTFPNPRAAHTVMAVNNNGPTNPSEPFGPGSVLVVDVSGDSEVSIAKVGVTPVHAVQQSSNQVLVLNQATTSTSTASLSKVFFSGTVINGTPGTISLPPNSAPNFVAVAPSDTTAYVTLPRYVPDPINFPGVVVPSVGVVNTQSNSLVATIPLQNDPFALAVTPDRSKLYVACDPLTTGLCSMSAFNTLDRSPRTISGTLSSSPIWLVVRSDSQRVYVLEANGTLAWLDTTSTSGPDALTEEPTIRVPGAAFMLYDGNLNRLYIPGGPQMAIVDVSQSAPQLLKTILIPQVPGLPPVDASAVAVAALPDGSRAYVASVSTSPQPSQVNISGVLGDGTTATYTYTLTGGHDLTPGIAIAVSGITAADGFNGTFTITAASGASCEQPAQACTFQTANTTVAAQTAVAGLGSSTTDNLFPQVTVINTSGNTIKTTMGVAGFPDATNPNSPYFVPVCAATRFRFSMAAGGDSSRVYMSSCDGGGVNVIDTSTDSFLVNLPAPFSARPPIPPSLENPPQNPVFLIAGP